MATIHTGADMISQFKPLSEADLQAYSDEAGFHKGYDYYLQHAIVEPTLSGSVLRAYCHGSRRACCQQVIKVLTSWLPLPVVVRGEAFASTWWHCCSPGSISRDDL
jgi:hypothetical protein